MILNLDLMNDSQTFQNQTQLCCQSQDHHQRQQGPDGHPLGHEEQVEGQSICNLTISSSFVK